MPGFTEITPAQNALSHRGPARSHIIDQIAQAHTQEALARIHKQFQARRRKESREYLAGFWPVGLGFLLACFAPLLSRLLAAYDPWGMDLVFPFVVLSARPELHLSGQLAAWLPQFMLYAQFPLEGLLAKVALKGSMTLFSTAIRALFFHAMATTLLLLVGGTIGQMAGF